MQYSIHYTVRSTPSNNSVYVDHADPFYNIYFILITDLSLFSPNYLDQ